MNSLLAEELQLPCGATLPNRIAKAAMTEGLADPLGRPTEALTNLYRVWSEGGSGLLLSGNIQIDSQHLERPGNVIIEGPPSEELKRSLAQWAAAATVNGNHFWAQISHAGRQTQRNINPKPKAPSAVKLGVPGGQFGLPEPMSIETIQSAIQGYAHAAKVVVDAGFTGVQIHAAHGYLISQFLSPRSNLRKDQYGGSLENRARFLLEVVSATRAAIGPNIPVSVKLNSADFQRGGFNFEDSLVVLKWLEAAGVDLVEISGGTYEQPKLLGIQGIEDEAPQAVATSTKAREAYFVDFAKAMQSEVTIPLMVTGGFRKRAVMEAALEDGSADIIGLGRPLCVVADSPKQLLAGREELDRFEQSLSLLPQWLKFLERITTIRAIASFAVQYWYYRQIAAIGENGEADKDLSVWTATKWLLKQQSDWIKRRKALLSKQD
ncbi:NADH:flavin oxidoreductase/NADH oxidase family protein [Umboniibacter marinipuniceus]|uniref:2,4-dienoyl-CoA reductase-like NADH-dependent reductase (Old Yellow Enzyme family) n=1 Tax=Umboniibacter marinipuniceus TaxID=569599 RepID=A0A3M0ADJ0_9GAMM|nr:NADH:flavin oxidoreductase/NADH oxidase family protein [Umboniibacter marinipuniceus]RMA82577.1 2,4-dienoyl-CoA reductase-like NADH-dependent reductase (Old Yellow Enzyme family) [Umboniibacter marinipuniceus]